MAIDKGSVITLFPSATVALGATGTGAYFNLLAKQGGTTYLRVTNGATGPDDRPIVTVEVADDASGTNNREVFVASSSLDDNAVNDFTHHHALSDRYVRVQFDNSLGDQAITAFAHHHPVDNVG